MKMHFYRPCARIPASRWLQIDHKSEKSQWRHNFPTWCHCQFFLTLNIYDDAFLRRLLTAESSSLQTAKFLHLQTNVSVNDCPAGNYVFKVNNRNIRTRCEICSKLTIKTPERCHWRRSGVFIVTFEHISHLVLVFLLLTLSRQTKARWVFIEWAHLNA